MFQALLAIQLILSLLIKKSRLSFSLCLALSLTHTHTHTHTHTQTQTHTHFYWARKSLFSKCVCAHSHPKSKSSEKRKTKISKKIFSSVYSERQCGNQLVTRTFEKIFMNKITKFTLMVLL